MKTHTGTLKIEEPCSQDWNKMLAVENGRFCNQCTKVVTDFTNFSDQQIIDFLKKSKGEVCGRVRMHKEQMKSYQFVYKNSTGFNNVIFRYSIAGILTFASLKSVAQGPKHFQQTSFIKDNSGKNNLIAANLIPDAQGKNKTKITIRATDKFTGKTLTYASIYIAETGKSYEPTEGSTFIIEIPDSLSDKTLNITIYASGHGSETRAINPKQNGSKVVLIQMSKEMDIKMGKMVYIPKDDTSSNKKCTK